MKKIQLFLVAVCLTALTASVFAESPFHMNNRVRVGYDDNIYQAGDTTRPNGTKETHKTDSSVRVLEEIEFLLGMNMPRTYLGFRYRPTIAYFVDRPGDDFDFWHDLDFNFIQKIAPKLTLSLNETLRYSQLPELQNDNYVVRSDDDNFFNAANATLAYSFRETSRLDFALRYILMRYLEDGHENDNYFSAIGGLTLRQQFASRTTLMGDLRYQMLVYDEADAAHNRDALSLYAGLGLEQSFNPKLIGSLRGGIENRNYDNDDFKSEVAPYGEVSLTFLPSPATRITGAFSYSIYESDIVYYLDQNRAYFSLSAAYDFTAKLSLFANAGYTINSYDADHAFKDKGINAVDANENTILLGARLSYRLNRSNWLETGIQFVSLDSEITNRESYERFRWDVIGWKINLF